MILELIAGLLIASFGAFMILAAFRERSHNPLEELLADIDGGTLGPIDRFEERLEENFLARIVKPFAGAITGGLGRLLPSNHLDLLRRKIVLAGLGGRISAEEFLSIQVLFISGGAVTALLVPTVLPLGGVQAIFVGLLLGVVVAALPNARLSSAREDRVESIQRDLPDALDLLAISVEAGVGFEAAIEAVTARFDTPLGHEMAHMLSEMELGVTRSEALRNLASRTGVPDVSGFVLAMVQADALGMPVGRTLRTQSDEMRRRRRQRAREAAAKLPVKLLFPLMLFILPSLFIVVLGPAVARISRTLIS